MLEGAGGGPRPRRPEFCRQGSPAGAIDGKGAVGLVLNRRTDVPLSRVLDLTAAKDRSDPVISGDLSITLAVLGCFESSAKVEKAENVFDRVYWFPTKLSSKRQFPPGLTLAFFTCSWDMPEDGKINCGPKCNWARRSFFRQTPPRY